MKPLSEEEVANLCEHMDNYPTDAQLAAVINAERQRVHEAVWLAAAEICERVADLCVDSLHAELARELADAMKSRLAENVAV